MNRPIVVLFLFFVLILKAGDTALASGGGGPSIPPSVKAAITAFDTDKNGQIDGSEFEAMPKSFRDLDQNGDSVLSVEEMGTSGGTYDPKDLILCVAFALVALLFSSLCSVAEAVLLSISPSYVANLEKAGDSNASKVKAVKTDVDRSLAAILTLNTIAHTVGSGGAGAYAAKYWGEGSVGIAMVVLTLLILFVSEIVPKTIGAIYWRGLAPISASFIQLLNLLLYPLIFVSEFITKLLAGGKSHHGFNREEFKALAGIGAESGQLAEKESQILNNLFRFPQLCVEDIMTPSTVVFALDENLTAREVLQQHQKIHFSRIPIFSNSRDNIVGFVLKNEILMDDIRNDGKTQLKDFPSRKLHAVSDKTPLNMVFENLLDNREHILLAIDEHGGLEGIVTLEDVVETLVGTEIVDEVDKHIDMRKVAREKWRQRMKSRGIDVRGASATESAE
ncbi:MAG: CNNM domain-containing protein [Planctomycetota bacterium]